MASTRILLPVPTCRYLCFVFPHVRVLYHFNRRQDLFLGRAIHQQPHRATRTMGAMCSGGTSSAAYIEKPKSGIAKNGQYVVDGVVIPRREMSKEEAARRGLKEDSWRGSMFGLTGVRCASRFFVSFSAEGREFHKMFGIEVHFCGTRCVVRLIAGCLETNSELGISLPSRDLTSMYKSAYVEMHKMSREQVSTSAAKRDSVCRCTQTTTPEAGRSWQSVIFRTRKTKEITHTG